LKVENVGLQLFQGATLNNPYPNIIVTNFTVVNSTTITATFSGCRFTRGQEFQRREAGRE
jgi:hypothetical protein